MFLDRAQFGRADERVAIFFREARRNLNFQIDLLNYATETAVDALHDADTVCGQSTLLAEAQHIDPGAGANR